MITGPADLPRSAHVLQISRIAISHGSCPSRQFETWGEAEAYLDAKTD